MKILVVDDSSVMRRKITRAVENVGCYEVVHASNGFEAVAQYQKEGPGLVTMDITMPEMDGIECVKKLVEMDKNALILVISALSEKSTTVEALKNGAKGFIKKPFDDESLALEIRKVLSYAAA